MTRKCGGVPEEMRVAPRLDDRMSDGAGSAEVCPSDQSVLPKDPHASFGKHVLTPTLALTSMAGATPPNWEVSTGTRICCKGGRPASRSRRLWGSRCTSRSRIGRMSSRAWYRGRGAARRAGRPARAFVSR